MPKRGHMGISDIDWSTYSRDQIGFYIRGFLERRAKTSVATARMYGYVMLDRVCVHLGHIDVLWMFHNDIARLVSLTRKVSAKDVHPMTNSDIEILPAVWSNFASYIRGKQGSDIEWYPIKQKERQPPEAIQADKTMGLGLF